MSRIFCNSAPMAIVAIIGGGRWARTLASVLIGLPEAPERVVLHSPNNSKGLEQWVRDEGLAARLGVSASWPEFGNTPPEAVIVANRAKAHVAAAMPALQAGIPVLVEKPLGITAEAVKSLQAAASATGALLAASHVFLFARYIDTFMARIAACGPALRLEMAWEDGAGDIVRGEMKSYDPAVTVFDDVLPHIVPLLGKVAGQPLVFESLRLSEGGARLHIQATTADLRVDLHLARDGVGRRRFLQAETASGPCVLDFCREPGQLSAPGLAASDPDPLWTTAPRPLGAMLTAFLKASRGAFPDARLSPDAALASAIFADCVRIPYCAQQKDWLAAHPGDDAGRAYALRENSEV